MHLNHFRICLLDILVQICEVVLVEICEIALCKLSLIAASSSKEPNLHALWKPAEDFGDRGKFDGDLLLS